MISQKNSLITLKLKIWLFVGISLPIVCVTIWMALTFSVAQQQITHIAVDGVTFSIESAKTPVERSVGLGGRDMLCDKCGMLFFFDVPDRYGFWMKDMRFPLDILWIRDGVIVSIEQNVSERDASHVYRPLEPADFVLELNAGTCDRYHLKEGSTVSFEKM